MSFHTFSAKLWAKSGSRGLLKNLIEVYNKIKSALYTLLYRYVYDDDLTIIVFTLLVSFVKTLVAYTSYSQTYLILY